MQSNKSSGTKPELAVRAALDAESGLRWYVTNVRGLPGTPDFAWLNRRAALFVHGCFWHGHECAERKYSPGYWQDKVAANRARDAASEAELRRMGWKVVVIWECELKAGCSGLVARLREIMP